MFELNFSWHFFTSTNFYEVFSQSSVEIFLFPYFTIANISRQQATVLSTLATQVNLECAVKRDAGIASQNMQTRTFETSDSGR